MTSGTWRLGRRPALDGLRAVAIVLVLLTHTRLPGLSTAGAVGVTVFFALSGFLITTLLLEQPIRLKAFYGRRARRLFPALAVVVVAVAVVKLVSPGFVATEDLVGSVTYSTNWINADGHLGFGGGALGHTWSLAIEEQFYLAWPLLLLACQRVPARRMAIFPLVVSVAILAWRAELWAHGASVYRLYYGTDVRADNLLLGCALAFWLHGSRRVQAPAAVGPLALAVIVIAALVKNLVILFVWLPTVVSLASCALIWACVSDRDVVPGLGWRPLVEVGKRSYGLYLWHIPILVAVATWVSPSPAIAWLVGMPVAWLLTCLSWRYVEQPFLRRRPVPAAAAVPGLGLGAEEARPGLRRRPLPR